MNRGDLRYSGKHEAGGATEHTGDGGDTLHYKIIRQGNIYSCHSGMVF